MQIYDGNTWFSIGQTSPNEPMQREHDRSVSQLMLTLLIMKNNAYDVES